MVTMEPSVKDILVHHTASNSEILIHRGRGMSGIDTLKVKGGGLYTICLIVIQHMYPGCLAEADSDI
jgi:hypothetical protein